MGGSGGGDGGLGLVFGGDGGGDGGLGEGGGGDRGAGIPTLQLSLDVPPPVKVTVMVNS
jgi:hypothetical protein